MPRSQTETRSPQLTFEALEHAEGEVAAYFARRQDKRRRDGWREAVEAAFAVIPAYHRGVFSLYHADRSWPEVIEKAFGQEAWIAIRLDCCDHPAAGSTPALEAAAAERIAAIIAKEGFDCASVSKLRGRARDHFERAVIAYAKARRKQQARTKAAPTALDQAAE